jgi:DNA-binding NtrC family response regulator
MIPSPAAAFVPNSKILVVDDDEMVLECLKRFLCRQFDVDTASGPEQALELVSKRGPYAVVLSDMRMPGLSGAGLVTQIRALSAETICVLLSGDSGDHDSSVFENGVFRLLEKPCRPDELIPVVDEAVAANRRYLQLLPV